MVCQGTDPFIHTVVTTRREAYYWLDIFFTFALGTAAGEFVAERFGLGYMAVSCQNIWRNWLLELAECRPLWLVDVRRRIYGVASAAVRLSVVSTFLAVL